MYKAHNGNVRVSIDENLFANILFDFAAVDGHIERFFLIYLLTCVDLERVRCSHAIYLVRLKYIHTHTHTILIFRLVPKIASKKIASMQNLWKAIFRPEWFSARSCRRMASLIHKMHFTCGQAILFKTKLQTHPSFSQPEKLDTASIKWNSQYLTGIHSKKQRV